jgi:hypothetical protein
VPADLLAPSQGTSLLPTARANASGARPQKFCWLFFLGWGFLLFFLGVGLYWQKSYRLLYGALMSNALGEKDCWQELALCLLSMALVLLKQCWLKMMPFDNKSEFQVIVDMPKAHLWNVPKLYWMNLWLIWIRCRR